MGTGLRAARTVVEDVDFDDAAGAVVVSVRPNAKARGRCGRCGRRSPRYDHGEGRRRWRALDLGTTKVFLEADAPRVRCRTHGPTVAAVPWARHGAGHTRDFDDMVAWLAVRTSKTAVSELMRIAWRTVGAIVTRVNADVDADVDRLDGLRRIGIDEISYKRGHHYLIVVVDHDTGALVWAGPGRNDAALQRVLRRARRRSAALSSPTFSADMADWIARVVAERAPNAVRCADPFHVVAWAIDALDVERRRAWNEAAGRRRTGDPPAQRPLHRHRRALKARPLRAVEEPRRPHRPATPRARLDRQDRPQAVARLPAQRRIALRVRRPEATKARKPSTAGSSGPAAPELPAFVDLHRKITAHRDAIDATLDHGLSNGLIESTNTKIRLLTRIAFGFHGHRTTHRPRHARPRLTPTPPPRPMTHGSSRRATNSPPGAR